MVICLDSRILLSWNETGSAGESNWNGQKKYERRTGGEGKTRARFCNHTFSKCTTKELSHCYVKPNVTFMRAPSSRSRPVGMVHKRPIWLAARPLSETHLKQTGTLGKVQCRSRTADRCVAQPLLEWMGRIICCPRNSGYIQTLENKKRWGWRGAVLSGGAMEKDVVAGGRPSWVGVGGGV